MVNGEEEWFRGATLRGLDPGGRWLAQQRGAGLRGRNLSVMLRLTDGDIIGFLNLWRTYAAAVIAQGGLPGDKNDPDPVDDKELRDAIQPPASFLLPPVTGETCEPDAWAEIPPEERVFSLTVGRGFLGLLIADVKVEGIADPRDLIASITIGSDLPEGASGPAEAEDEVPPLPDGKDPDAVIVAVIDGGLPLAHERFRKDRLHTRIEYAWVQDVTHQPPSFVNTGREFDKGQLDGLLAQCDIGGQVDEDMFYRLTGQADFSDPNHNELGYRVTHGAHVMDLAAGLDYRDPMETRLDKMPIIAVQVPNAVTADTSGASLEPYVEAAFRYIRKRAANISAARGTKPLPVVVNFSYGVIAGPHDGKSSLELAMEHFIQTRPGGPGHTAVVLPSGNRYMSQCHAVLTPDLFDAATEKRTLTWRVQPDDGTESFLEFWMPETVAAPLASRIKMTITPPGGPTSPVISEIDGDNWVWKPHGLAGQVVCEIGYSWQPMPQKKGLFSISIQRTASFDNSVELAPSGDWIIEIEDTGLAPGDVVNGWIQRDDTIYSDHARGRQSYFSDPDYQVFNPPGVTPEGDWNQTDSVPDCPIRKAGLISAIATGDKTVTTAGFYWKSGQMALYSAGGPTVNPQKDAPDAAAPSDTSRVHFGTIGAGSRSGSVAVLSGTSVASPRLARRIALAMLAGQAIERPQVAAWAVADEASVFNTRPFGPPPVERSANGRLTAPTGRKLRRIDFP